MVTKQIQISTYDYPLPDNRIARYPLAQRDACLLLRVDARGNISDHVFTDLPTLLPDNALLVYNNTRVINARLRMHKQTGATIEIFCLEPHSPADYAQNFASTQSCRWTCLVGNSKRWRSGSLSMALYDVASGQRTTMQAERISQTQGKDASQASSVVQFSWDNPAFSFSRIIELAGEIPIPPYLDRDTEDSDSGDYQTVFSHVEGSVAAPTAGLHFTDNVLDAIDRRGIQRCEVTLHVGAGTFRPVKADEIGQHTMHAEYIEVSRDLIARLHDAIGQRPVIAVGTTSVRTLESLYHIGCLIIDSKWDGEVPQWYPYQPGHPDADVRSALAALIKYLDDRQLSHLVADTRIIIAPGYRYRIVDAMVTNFHQPRSTLLLLVSALIGERWRDAYSHALLGNYRFLSYGDACLFEKSIE